MRNGSDEGKDLGQETVPGLKLVFVLRSGAELIRRIMWSREGLIAAPASDGSIAIWDAERGVAIRKIVSDEATAYSVAWSPDGQTLAIGGDTGNVSLWDAGDGRLITRLRGHLGWVNALAWSVTGVLASGSEDGTVRLWDVPNHICRVLEAHRGNINGLAWTSDGARLCSCSGDRDIAVWDCSRLAVCCHSFRAELPAAFSFPGISSPQAIARNTLATEIRP